jgi:hypothetical protein
MGKKEKSVFVLAENFKAMIAVVPKLEAFLKVHNEIAAGYQKYRKNGGASIPGIEKHLGVKNQPVAVAVKTKKQEKAPETKTPKTDSAAVKVKKKAKV